MFINKKKKEDFNKKVICIKSFFEAVTFFHKHLLLDFDNFFVRKDKLYFFFSNS